MNDKDFAAQQRRIMPLVKKWKLRLGLNLWDIDSEFYRGPFEREGEWFTGAMAVVRWEYMDATLMFDLVSVTDLSDADVEKMVVHELMHVILKELQHTTDDFMKHEERVATMLAQAFVFLAAEKVRICAS